MAAPRTRLVLGLGNPGAEYDGTRHNVGFDVLDRIAARHDRGFLLRGRAEVARVDLPPDRNGRELSAVLAKPTTYMNRSGRAARDLLADLEGRVDLLVLCDDFHLPLGQLRCRGKGSAGGQKGLASILEHVPDREVPRLRIGIGEPGKVPAERFVLMPFKRGEQEAVDAMLERAATHVDDWLHHGDLDRLMRDANARVG